MMAIHDNATIARFLAKVDRRGPDECWPWTGSLDEHGYGKLRVGNPGRPRHAQRVAWEIVNGDTGGLFVCHSCDNPICVNPDHLWLGTALDNMRDCIQKGRNSPPPVRLGEANNKAKLTAEQVREVRILTIKGWPITKIAEKFNVDKTNISCILLGKTWAWFEPEHGEEAKKSRKTTMTEDQVRLIRSLLKQRGDAPRVSRLLGIPLPTIYSIKYRQTWSWLT
jgi:hypothetical protein